MLNFLLLVMFKTKPGAYHRPPAHPACSPAPMPPSWTLQSDSLTPCPKLPPPPHSVIPSWLGILTLDTFFKCHVHVFFHLFSITPLNLEVNLAKQAPGLLFTVLPPVFHLLAFSSHSTNTEWIKVCCWFRLYHFQVYKPTVLWD